MVLAVKGQGATGGEFEVHEILEPGFPPQRLFKPSLCQSVLIVKAVLNGFIALGPSKGRFIALVSGLNFGMDGNMLHFHLLSDFLTGHSGCATVRVKLQLSIIPTFTTF